MQSYVMPRYAKQKSLAVRKRGGKLRDTIYKYIGQDAETRKQTVFAFVTAVVDFLTAFHIIEFTDDQIQAIYKLALCIVTAIVWGYCSHYKNNNYTPEAVVATVKLRDAKKKRMMEQETVEEPEDSYIEEEEVTADEV